MNQFQNITQFKQLLETLSQLLHNYQTNFNCEIFEQQKGETNEEAYKRGEEYFNKYEQIILILIQLIEKKDELNLFIEKCQENKMKLIEQKNELINKLLRIKKNNSTKEEYLNLREFWNKKREETIDERNRRECE